ncbi:MAG: hypothetical protein A2275_04015 [Bacteroidetes bacterium RIFOXYA12_FULL_35_11]|nr:MAG: hypothetical protein A2X01_02955 [Bacteroidetes bacterium GWF2_35_48]OFY73456.1 MAG: hypothetical protein A2275_04015 [Bacteroidetes bacterium RIFOXYA12_FULL_35_11]OFY95307.1 MAG: hypothetical protein A2491_20805 [Bacteroidetes bacterium RIFOXYC12_FULL_35_7]HBX52360.1 hypothetical protein [Bacteroidales bacterium]
MSNNKEHFSKRSTLFIFLAAIFLSTAIIAELIGNKIFSLEELLGIAPVNLFGSVNLNFSAGVIPWPIVFVMTDIINEFYGRKGVRRITFLTIFFIAYVFIILLIATNLPPATDLYKNNDAFVTVFSQGMTMIIASLIAFLVGQLLDSYVFYLLKKKWSSSKSIWLRAMGSNLFSQLVDSFIVLIIAFYFTGQMGFYQVITLGLVAYAYKFFMSFALLPVIYFAHFAIGKYLGKEVSEQMVMEDIKKK